MLFQTILTQPVLGLIIFLSLIIAIAVHEAAHAFTAIKLGDNTPKIQGRNTLNPLKHLDPIGTAMLLFVGIGWGKPVQYNPYNLKHPRKDAMKIAVAGPLSNLIMACAGVLLLFVFTRLDLSGFNASQYIEYALEYFVYLNLVLMVFNMIPVEPLDGFKVVNGLLPPKYAAQWQETARYGIYILLVLLITGAVGKIMDPFINLFMNLFNTILGL